MKTGEEQGTHSRVIIGVFHPLGEKVRDQLLALRKPTRAGGADGVNLVVPAPRVTLGQLPGPVSSKKPLGCHTNPRREAGLGCSGCSPHCPLCALGSLGTQKSWHRVQPQFQHLQSE